MENDKFSQKYLSCEEILKTFGYEEGRTEVDVCEERLKIEEFPHHQQPFFIFQTRMHFFFNFCDPNRKILLIFSALLRLSRNFFVICPMINVRNSTSITYWFFFIIFVAAEEGSQREAKRWSSFSMRSKIFCQMLGEIDICVIFWFFLAPTSLLP